MEQITTIEDLAALIQRTMASKEDLLSLEKRMASKEDLLSLEKRMASKEDIQRLERKVDDGFFAVNRRIDLLREDISDLPDIREELTDLGVRMDRVEQKVGLTK